MKACPHCNEPMAEVATHCPGCGQAYKGQLGPVRGQHDEPLGFQRDQGVLKAILIALGLGIFIALVWFVR